MHGTMYSYILNIQYICFEFEGKKAHCIFPTMKASMNACIELVGFSTSNNVKINGLNFHMFFFQ